MKPNEILDFIGIDSEKDFSDGVTNIRTLSLRLASSFLQKPRKIALFLSTLYDAQCLIDNITDFIPQDKVVFFPFDEVLRIESLGASNEMKEERLNALFATLVDEPVIFISHSTAFMRDIKRREDFESFFMTFKVGDEVNRINLSKKVEQAGFYRVNKVTNCFQYARRGEIFDIWPSSHPLPVRIEFFDDEIEEIREFSPDTELSSNTISSVSIVPASEYILSDIQKADGFSSLLEEVSQRRKLTSLQKQELEERIRLVMEKIETEGMRESEARYLPYFDNTTKTVNDYLQDFETYIYHPIDFVSTTNNYKTEEELFFKELFKQGQALSKEKIYEEPRELLLSYKHINIEDKKGAYSTSDIVYHNTNLWTSINMINSLHEDGQKIVVCLTEERMLSFIEYLNGEGKPYSIYPEQSDLVLCNYKLIAGFQLTDSETVVLSAAEIFGLSKQSGKFLTRFKEAKTIKKFEELDIGDYVVSEEHGIGQYIGVEPIKGLDYLKIKYSGENYLYVPLSKYKLIRKYSGKEGIVPTLDTIGGTSWARRKERIKSRVSYLADKLLAIYAERMAKPGYAFMDEKEMEEQFANGFPYPLTISQAKTYEDIKNDMESPHPMDRLLAGDVGFGKTELAFRACYKAILSGKQAAFLCPTTILAKQHTEVAIKRFKGFGVEIAMLSRFTKPNDVKRYTKRIAEGKIHLIIGTHKILNSELRFNDLGLLVIDEEQRFGVTHKERIKELTTNIDVLTLTATPIPRTLQMSLLNVKSLSLLLEAPQNRMPIKTYVSKYDKGLVKEVISRELGRKGQVYYLHNRIDSIYSCAKSLQELFPHAYVKVAHGGMTADEIGDVMNDFYDGKIDILVCTSIIETGLDIPNVNTIIIEKADHFGLSQLYQIKGRVGRSNRLAYAYLFYDEYKELSEQGRKRLKAIKEFTELGSGYKIANRDLNIRGAGDILGKEQAGFIDSIGYDTYMKLLKEVVTEKKLVESGKNEETPRDKHELSFSLDSHIPSQYASDSDRIVMYQELSDIHDTNSLKAYEKKVRDVYGPIPEEVRNLFIKREIEILLNSPIFDDFDEGIDKYTLVLSYGFTARDGMMTILENALKDYTGDLLVRVIRKKITLFINRTPDYLLTLYNIIISLIKVQ